MIVSRKRLSEGKQLPEPPGGIKSIIRQTGYSQSADCSALVDLETVGLIRKRHARRGPDKHQVRGYAWFGPQPVPSLWEDEQAASKK